MTFLTECSPITAAIYFIAVLAPLMTSSNPITAAFALAGALFLSFHKKSTVRRRGGWLLLFIIIATVNPLFSHNGKTVLFLINDTPITLESVMYGVTSSLTIVAVLFWSACAAGAMTSDRLLYLFGILSPKLSLVLSSAIRYIPLFGRRSQQIEDTGRAMGLYKDGNVIDTVKGKLHVFSVMVTWALEDGIHTADSMAARGYGVTKRTQFSLFRIRRTDVIFILTSLALVSPTLIFILSGQVGYEFYPTVIAPAPSLWLTLSYVCYALLVLLPQFTEITGELKWKYLTSKI